MNEEKLKAARGEVINSFANIETVINTIISQHYLKRVNRAFILEVLYDELFSFGLRRNILEKIVPEFDPGQMRNLRELNRIRNYFAHCGLQMTDLDSDVPFYPNPRKSKKQFVEWDTLYGDFNRLVPEVLRYLGELMKRKDILCDDSESTPSTADMKIGYDD